MTGMNTSKASQETLDGSVFVSPKCAIALSLALDNLNKWFSSQSNLEHANFKTYVEAKYELVKRSVTDEQISIYLYPKLTQRGLSQRGGGINYVIDKDLGTILERKFDR